MKRSERGCLHPVGDHGEVCGRPVLARNLCARHYHTFRDARIATSALRDDEELVLPERKPWQYEGDEAALIAMTEQQVKLEKENG